MKQGEWWRRTPVRFACKSGCTDCCRKPGLVAMDAHDIRDAAHFLKITPGRFKSDYLQREGSLWVIEVTERRPCPFLLPAGCRIHSAKPRQCRAYPFWPEIMESEASWNRAALDCPGIGSGPEAPAESVRKWMEG